MTPRQKTAPGDPQVVLREAAPADCQFTWEVNNHPSVREFSLHTEPIPWDTHVEWFRDRIGRTDSVLLIGIRADERVGVVRLDIDSSQREATIALAVASDHRGRGVGTRMIVLATELAATRDDVDDVIAHIRPGNEASQRAFTNASFCEIDGTVVDGVDARCFLWSPAN